MVACALAGSQGLLITLTSGIVGLSMEDARACDAYESKLMAAVARAGWEHLESIVLWEGCAMDPMSPGCAAEQEKISGFFPRCEDAGVCGKAKLSVDLRADNISVQMPWNGDEQAPMFHVKVVRFTYARLAKFPAVCEDRLRRFIEGDGSTQAKVFESTNFCKFNISDLPVPTFVPCDEIENQTDGEVKCNPLEQWANRKVRMYRASFKSSCHSSLEIQEPCASQPEISL